MSHLNQTDRPDPTDPTRKDRLMNTTINPQTEAWIAARECDDEDVARYARDNNLDGDEFFITSENVVIDLAVLHRAANISLVDVREYLTHLRASAEYLLGTLPAEVGR